MSLSGRELREVDVDPDPLRQFAAWFALAQQSTPEREAAALATAGVDGAPSVRMVLVKRVDERGFAFFTNYDSRKGRDLAVNPRAALLFYWPALARQVRVEGDVQRTSREETIAYARSRPRGSQLSALASPQTEVVADRAFLERRVDELAAAHAGGELPVSERWGGFRLVPSAYEFWQQRDDRLHDRVRYLPQAPGSWLIERLAP